MGGGCSMEEGIRYNPDCCEVSIESISNGTMGGPPNSTASQVAQQKAPQPPPVALYAAISILQPAFGGPLPLYHRADPHFDHTEIYLVTERLRI